MADKGQKSTMCQFETLEAVRKNIISKVRGRVKKDATLGNKVLDMVKKYKEEASNDMKEWNSHLKKRHDDLKPKGMKRKKSKDRKKSKKKKTSSSSSDSSSESQKKKKKTGKSNKEESDDDDEEDEKEEEDEKDDESGSHRDSSTLSLPGTGSVRTGAKGDDDLWLHQKFSRSNSGPKTSFAWWWSTRNVGRSTQWAFQTGERIMDKLFWLLLQLWRKFICFDWME